MRSGAVPRQLVVMANHLCDFWNPRPFALGLEVCSRQAGGGLQVVEGAMRPDPEIVIGRGDGDSFNRGFCGSHRETEIQHAVGVVPIANEIVAQCVGVSGDHGVQGLDIGENGPVAHDVGVRDQRHAGWINPAYRLCCGLLTAV